MASTAGVQISVNLSKKQPQGDFGSSCLEESGKEVFISMFGIV